MCLLNIMIGAVLMVGGPRLSSEAQLEDAKMAWRKYEQLALHVQGRYTKTFIDNGMQAPRREEHEVRRNGPWTLRVSRNVFDFPNGVRAGLCEVRGINSKYLFELQREEESKDWVLRHLEFKPIAPAASSTAGSTLLSLGPVVKVGRLPNAVEEPGFNLISFAPDAQEGPQIYALRFELKRGPQSFRVRALLHQGNYWCVRGGSFEECFESKVVHRGNVLCAYHIVDSLPIPRERITTVSAFIQGRETHHVCKESFEFANVSKLPPESDFTVSAFGLPEPYGVEWEKPIPWWLYLSGGGLGIIVLLAVVYRLRKAGWLGQAAV